MQAIVDRSLASVSESIVKAVDARLGEFKTRVVAEICRAISSNLLAAWKVLEKFESAIDALDQSRIEKARETLKEGMDLVLHQIKIDRIADKSEFYGGS